MCHWLTGEWVHCQLTHMELQLQSDSTDTEIVQDELKHSAPILSLHTPRESTNVSMGVVGARLLPASF